MKKRIIPFLAIATLLAACGEKPNTPSTSTGTDSVQTEVTKYTITVSKSSDYTVEGLVAEGYEEGATVTFTVTVKNDKKEIDKVIVDGTQLVASNGTYTFKMPSKNVAVVVQLKDKAGVKVAIVTVDNESPKVGDVVNVTLKLDNVAVTEGVTVTATTGADLVTIEGTKVTCKKVGAVALEVAATVDGVAYKKDANFTIGEGVAITSIKTVQDTVATYSGKNATYPSQVTVEARVLNVNYNGLFIYDGTAVMMVRSNKVVNVARVGEYVRVTGTPTRYKGSDTDERWWQFDSNDKGLTVTKIEHAEIALPTAVAPFTGADVNSYVTPAAGTVKLVSFTGTVAIDGTHTVIKLEGATRTITFYSNNHTVAAGLKYNFEAYLGELQQGQFLVAYITKVEAAEMDPVESVTITNGATAELNAGATLQLDASVLPATADPRVTWSSSDATKAKVDEKGKVTGVAEGKATITATTTGKDSSGNPKTATIEINVGPAEAIDPSQLKLAGTINFNFSAPATKPNYSKAGSVGTTLKANGGFTAATDSTLSLESSSGESSVYYADPRDKDQPSTKFDVEGIKFGASKKAGKLVLTFNSDAKIAKVVVKELTSWSNKYKSSLTINNIGEAFVTTAKGGDVEFTLPATTNELSFSSDKVSGASDYRVVFSGLEIYVK